jgi:hypothetical protein
MQKTVKELVVLNGAAEPVYHDALAKDASIAAVHEFLKKRDLRMKIW